MHSAVAANPADTVETVLREELAHGDAMLGTITPILRHLLANDDHSVFGDEVVARVRAMIADIARQLQAEMVKISGQPAQVREDKSQLDHFTAEIAAAPGLLSHTHALALEWQLTERLQSRLSLDPVLSPLLQALIASNDPMTAGMAMNLLAAQVRFCQGQRRMTLALGELPGDLLHGVLVAMTTSSDPLVMQHGEAASAAIRARFDESASRLGLIARLVASMGGGAVAALSVTHAGVAMFLSALHLACGQSRDVCTLATNESQLARLALALRAAGLKPQAVAEQFAALHPEIALPDGFEALGTDRAAAILAVSGAFSGT